jgi:hypothetical protein
MLRSLRDFSAGMLRSECCRNAAQQLFKNNVLGAAFF